VVGHSTGGSYALACAVAMPERVTTVGPVSSIAPWNEDGFADLVPSYVQPIRDAYARDPEAAVEEYRGWIAELRRGMLHDPDAALDAFATRTLSEADLALMRDHPTLRGMMKICAADHVAAGTEGMFEERMAGHIMDWGFELSDVPLHVHVFQGADDAMLPATVGRALADRLPRATYHELPGGGHFLPLAREREVVGVLLEAARERSQVDVSWP
jgi:pimeloyl-ACP methyl ester carboxylesterase